MHGPGAGEDSRFRAGERNPLAASLHRLRVHEMVRLQSDLSQLTGSNSCCDITQHVPLKRLGDLIGADKGEANPSRGQRGRQRDETADNHRCD